MAETLRLDCNACKTPASMTATKTAKFSSVIRVIGVLLLIPSFLGIGLAGIMLLATIMTGAASTAQTEAEQTGAAIGSAIGVGISLFIGLVSLVGGLLGWLLLLNRKVYKCLRCGFVLDRA